ncbi:M18BP protein, partial [Alcedo cyanopectus]|nr:M18BP protein [Ceyx cyanopectus]
SQKIICLSSWRIKVMDGNTAICVEGKRRDQKGVVWHSSAVTERLARGRVRTMTGNVYELQGNMETSCMEKEGFPARFIQRFTFGIPKRWKEYVEEFLQERQR